MDIEQAAFNKSELRVRREHLESACFIRLAAHEGRAKERRTAPVPAGCDSVFARSVAPGAKYLTPSTEKKWLVPRDGL
jgi:hypothetical protein